jgi:hypothetical protein
MLNMFGKCDTNQNAEVPKKRCFENESPRLYVNLL